MVKEAWKRVPRMGKKDSDEEKSDKDKEVGVEKTRQHGKKIPITTRKARTT